MASKLEERALTAVGAVAASHGLAHDHAAVAHSGSNVLVHLRPAPVIARVMTGTVALHDQPQEWLEREISVLKFLADSGLAVAPSSLIAPGPHHHDGLWMTFAEWIADARPATCVQDPHRLGRALRELHDALRRFDGELADFEALCDGIERLLDQLRPTGPREIDTVASLRERLAGLREEVFETTIPAQALHGDVSLTNLLSTPRGLVWNDFEDTLRGPVHWDLAGYLLSLRANGASSRSIRVMLDAYGWDDEQELSPFLAAHGVYDEIWRLYDWQRRHSGRTHLSPDDAPHV
jgi:hypothetical protein